jgi:hypothetical protein
VGQAEAALLHWLYLSASPRSHMSAPPLDLDLGELDLGKLKRMAKAMRLDEGFKAWIDRKIAQERSSGPNEQIGQGDSRTSG